MDDVNLMKAMIGRCRDIIAAHERPVPDQPEVLRPKHLIWMCERLAEHSDSWTSARMNRWIGFIQCAMIANRMIDIEQAKAMFDQAKNAFGEPSHEFTAHLDPDDPFELDLGGQG